MHPSVLVLPAGYSDILLRARAVGVCGLVLPCGAVKFRERCTLVRHPCLHLPEHLCLALLVMVAMLSRLQAGVLMHSTYVIRWQLAGAASFASRGLVMLDKQCRAEPARYLTQDCALLEQVWLPLAYLVEFINVSKSFYGQREDSISSRN